jgi:polyisoprenoid-binding protein YceI
MHHHGAVNVQFNGVSRHQPIQKSTPSGEFTGQNPKGGVQIRYVCEGVHRMSKVLKFLLGFALVAVIAIAAVAYTVLRPTPSASAPITAIPIAVDTPAQSAPTTATETATETVTETEANNTGAVLAAPATNAQNTEAQSTEAQNAGTQSSETESTETEGTETEGTETQSAETQDTPAERIIFEIVQAESQARFIVGEILNGSPKTVVGTTDQVAGQIAVDITNPANTQLGTIQVNARTLVTDSGMRNRMIQSRILSTSSYEYITFVPTSLEGLPEVATVGETFTLQITGDLTVRDVTRQVTFTAEITPVSETRLQGIATATILRSDYGITIPQVPSVAGVDDDVILEIEFVAVPV